MTGIRSTQMRILLLVLLAAFGQAFADNQVRIMVVFDTDGHRIENIYRSINRKFALPRSTDRTQLKRRFIESGSPAIFWYSAAGDLLLQNEILDPRFKHVPVVGAASSANPVQHIFQSSGAYMIAGPATASKVTIALPAVYTGQRRLQSERWSFDLSVFP